MGDSLRHHLGSGDGDPAPEPPSGAVGSDGGAVTVCRCGAGPHPEHDDRCAAGHVLQGNGLALVAGHRSAAFWAAHEDARQELRQAIVEDAGHRIDDAPRALLVAADGLAQAVLVRDSAFARIVEAGGPLTSTGRTRRAFAVWTAALDRVERHVRLIGLSRVPPAPPSLAEWMKQRQANDEEDNGMPAADDAGEEGRT